MGAKTCSYFWAVPVLGAALGLGASTSPAQSQTLASISLSDPLSIIISGVNIGPSAGNPVAEIFPAARMGLIDAVFAPGDASSNPASAVAPTNGPLPAPRLASELTGSAGADMASLGVELNLGLTDDSEIYAAATFSFAPRHIFETLIFDQFQPGQGALAQSALGGQHSYRYADQREVTISVGGRKYLGGQDGFTHYVTASAAATIGEGESDEGGGLDVGALGFGSAISFQVSGAYGMRYNMTEKVSLGFVAGLAYESPREDEGKRNVMGEYEEANRTGTFDIPLTLAVRFNLN